PQYKSTNQDYDKRIRNTHPIVVKSEMGKRKIIREEDFGNILLPVANDVLGIAIQMLGNDRIRVKCQDGYVRLCRIRGKMKRRFWIREGDVVLVSPWDFQFEKRGDIYWRYRRNQAEWLRSKGYLTVQR
ncbi:MAG: translation initiation factor eIF-1A, partial [Candidatus Bathyarchaeia archaeon]